MKPKVNIDTFRKEFDLENGHLLNTKAGEKEYSQKWESALDAYTDSCQPEKRLITKMED